MDRSLGNFNETSKYPLIDDETENLNEQRGNRLHRFVSRKTIAENVVDEREDSLAVKEGKGGRLCVGCVLLLRQVAKPL